MKLQLNITASSAHIEDLRSELESALDASDFSHGDSTQEVDAWTLDATGCGYRLDIELLRTGGPFGAKDDFYDVVIGDLEYVPGIDSVVRVLTAAEVRSQTKRDAATEEADASAIALSGSVAAHQNAITKALGGVPTLDVDGNDAAETGKPIATTPDGHIHPTTGQKWNQSAWRWQ